MRKSIIRLALAATGAAFLFAASQLPLGQEIMQATGLHRGTALGQTFPGVFPREVLRATRAYFVDDINGNDSNPCVASGAAACKTLNGAVAKIQTLDINGNTVTVSVAAPSSSYAGMACQAPLVGLGAVTFTGNTVTPTSVPVAGGAAPAFDVQNGCFVTLQGFSATSTSNNGVQAILNGRITLGNMDVGTVCASCVQIYGTRGGYVESNAAVTAHGTGAYFAQGSHRGEVRFSGGSVTWTGNSTYNNGTMGVDSGEIIGTGGVTISNGGFTVTGFRFSLINAGVLQWNGSAPPLVTDIPGTATGMYYPAIGGVVAVASLPACGAAMQGARYFVTDQNTAVAYHGAVTGGGANKQGVTCDGAAWYQD